nr:uncharacterized protein LOC112543886 [Pelodiscus sinensis]|eukprot:XP_025034840.1 uncharacterized protein LOC112543886 [Pelodiscus sinensis]
MDLYLHSLCCNPRCSWLHIVSHGHLRTGGSYCWMDPCLPAAHPPVVSCGGLLAAVGVDVQGWWRGKAAACRAGSSPDTTWLLELGLWSVVRQRGLHPSQSGRNLSLYPAGLTLQQEVGGRTGRIKGRASSLVGAEPGNKTDVSCLLLHSDPAAEPGSALDLEKTRTREELELMGLLVAEYPNKPKELMWWDCRTILISQPCSQASDNCGRGEGCVQSRQLLQGLAIQRGPGLLAAAATAIAVAGTPGPLNHRRSSTPHTPSSEGWEGRGERVGCLCPAPSAQGLTPTRSACKEAKGQIDTTSLL